MGAGNGATIVYHKIFEEAGKGDVLTAETAGNFFPARVTGAGESTIGLPLAPKGVTSFPPQRAAEAAELRGGLGAQSLRQHDGRAL